MRYEIIDLGNGPRRHSVYDMPVVHPANYWANVTDVPCPMCKAGTNRLHEAGYVPGSRLCDNCGRYFQAKGSVRDGITLVRDSRFDEPIYKKRVGA